ncbi:alpha/beta hydrolase family protein [Streptomyces sp. NPDC014894]|uniref:alpha/beta hydrolase family protein n=1 Tax=Streptomyces sp. NPDC014894 TaxID=3364931 RepID=UPI0036F97C1B
MALLAGSGIVAVVLWQHSYDMDERRVTIRRDGHTLHAVLTAPRGGDGKPRPLVVVIHGDGPVDATHEDGYKPLWEAYARAGYATLSWSKPGVGGAPGDWLGQSMADRAAEAVAAIGWARSQDGVDPDRIGLWGASQAGWVLPKIVERTPVDFVIAVAPAVNWLRQGRHHLLAELRKRGASPATVDEEIARSDLTRRLLARGASFEEYTRAMGGPGEMTAGRWGFITRNHTADVTADLPALRGVPLLLMLPGQDVHVDTAETGTVYRRELAAGGGLTVRHYPDAAHTLVRAELGESGPALTLTALLAPRSLFAKDALGDQERFLRGLRETERPVRGD